ncbi:MAG: CoA transferase, partial [Rhodospirillum sp.]|nr:CoA transferase [Rhodospirillum sp.]
GIAAAYATLAALYRKARTGEGQQVEISLLKTALAIMNPILIEAATGARHRVATGNRSPISGPSDAFETRDGWVMIQVIGDAMFARLADVIGKPTLANAPEYASDIKRGENGAALSDVVAAWCREKTSGEVMGILSAARIPCVPILGPAEALMSPEIRGGGYFSGSDPANAPLVASLADIAGTVPVRPAPALGEHNREILEELSMT